MENFRVRRLSALLCLATLGLTSPLLAADIPRDLVTLLYRKETTQAPNRMDPTIQAVGLALERELLNRNFRITQTPPDVLRMMDQSAAVIVSFAPDAGLSMVYSVYRDMRPLPGVDVGIAEIRIEARVFVGAGLLSAERGRGQVQTRLDAAVKSYAERRAFEVAADKAAIDLMDRVQQRLQGLTPEQLNEFAALSNPAGPGVHIVAPPEPPPVPVAPQVAATPQPVPVVPQPAPPPTPVTAAPPPAPSVQPESGGPLAPPARRFAVVVGIADYSPQRQQGMGATDLPGTRIDVRNISGAFERIGFARQDITVLQDGAATSVNVRAALEKIARAAGPNDLIAFYISGHGMPADMKPKGSSMPVLYDYRGPSGNAPDFKDLLSSMAGSASQRLVMIVDTCHSGGASSILPIVEISSRGLRASAARGAPRADVVAEAIQSGKDFAILTAARFEELSWEVGNNGGLFSKALSDGLVLTAGKAPLKEVMEVHVARPVIDKSRDICARNPRDCPTGQQTPTLGYSRQGHMIRM